ncbi:amidohydrolase [Mangrovicoccus ximenensis]|uniref:amidohydrolase n=1 Tax=Mangrovicoccus ximenensis TaxID=1911570 RepID=UPI001F17143F|nr:amidohydrolase [Mangrovicoccus ximenensis]
MVDLGGRALLPGFVDSHGHVMLGGLQALSANLLAPPDGDVTDIAGLVAELSDWAAENAEAVARIDLIVGFGYDQSQLAEQRHPTREDLDRVSAEVPVLIIHQSGHLAAMNSLALERAGLTADTPDPAGGVIRRGPDGNPTGVLEENAFFHGAGGLFANLGPEAMLAFAEAGSKLWASFGYTTAQEGRATPDLLAAAQAAGAQGLFPIDVAVYPDVLIDRQAILDTVSDSYEGHVRVAGAKLTIDGSPQGFTALRDRPYYDPVGDYPPGYKGYAAAEMEQVADAVDWAFANGIQILTHANGEGASDMLLAAVKAAEETHGMADRRPVLIHGQFLREDQVDALHDLRIFPSLFPMHTFYWGDWHRDHTVGPANGDNISPTGWVRQRGMIFGTHHDAPVALPDSMRVLSATVTRRTRSGDILGPDQRVDVPTALKAMTIWPAWQHFEDGAKGSIAPGKLADMVVLSADPAAVAPEQLASLRVLATIKEGAVIYEAEDIDGDAATAGTGFGGAFPPGAPLAPGYELPEADGDAGGGKLFGHAEAGAQVEPGAQRQMAGQDRRLPAVAAEAGQPGRCPGPAGNLSERLAEQRESGIHGFGTGLDRADQIAGNDCAARHGGVT